MNMMMALILIAALITASQSGCPSMCSCSDSSVLCIQKELESVPSFESLINDPVIIDLSGNKINIIDNDDFSFDKSDKVKEIYLNNTELLDIDSEAFDELENLQELYLGDNLLNSVPDNLIQDLPNMILLDMSNNQFSGNMPKIFSQSLEVLAIANSKVTNIPTDALKDLPSLKLLLLQQNSIKAISPLVFEGFHKNSLFVRLSYNIWECSCENIESFEFLAGQKYIDTSEPYQCLTSSGAYVNVYSEGAIDDFKNKCANIPIRSQVIKDLTSYKENRFIAETRQSTEDQKTLDTPNKPYSLVKEDMHGILEQSSTTIESNEIIDSVEEEYPLAENEYPLTEDDDILVKDINYTFEKGIDITEYDASILPKLTFDISVGAFIGILCSFIIGLIFGFCIHQFASTIRVRSLETSDSRTKLILP